MEVRAELELNPFEPLNCLDLAAHYSIPVVALSELKSDGAQPESIRRLQSNAARFSALTVCAGTRRLIVFNHRHPPGRQANSLAHELSHVILEHPPAPAVGEGGCRYWDGRLEDEADWLAATLLVPREAALRWIRGGRTIEDGANHFGVSVALFKWRVNSTGVARQVSSSQYWRKSS